MQLRLKGVLYSTQGSDAVMLDLVPALLGLSPTFGLETGGTVIAVTGKDFSHNQLQTCHLVSAAM